MNADMTRLQVWRRWQESKLATVFAAYEDVVTAARGVEWCRDLSRRLGRDCAITQHIWLFDEFRVPKLRDLAAGEAAVSDLVLISAHRHEKIPQELQGWMDLWLRLERNRPPIMLILSDSGAAQDADGLETCLEAVARTAKVEFLVQSEEDASAEDGFPAGDAP